METAPAVKENLMIKKKDSLLPRFAKRMKKKYKKQVNINLNKRHA